MVLDDFLFNFRLFNTRHPKVTKRPEWVHSHTETLDSESIHVNFFTFIYITTTNLNVFNCDFIVIHRPI